MEICWLTHQYKQLRDCAGKKKEKIRIRFRVKGATTVGEKWSSGVPEETSSNQDERCGGAAEGGLEVVLLLLQVQVQGFVFISDPRCFLNTVEQA